MPAAVVLLLLQLVAAPLDITGVITDPTGAPLAGARVAVLGTSIEVATAIDGSFRLGLGGFPAILTVAAAGFADRRLHLDAPATRPLHVILEPRGITAVLTVSAAADRLRMSTPAAVTVLDRTALESAPALTLDEQLRAVPGFSLFRRSSSRVANPTTQGVTLRGLAASGSSRATVLADGVSLADPFGGWVYWDRIPAAAIDRVEVARGGASDVYGSDAMGGAIRIDTPTGGARLIAEVGDDRTARASTFAGGLVRSIRLRGAAERFTTDGFVVVAPESRGTIDIPAWSAHTALFGSLGAPVASAQVEVRGGYFSEDRGNGTPYQENAATGRDLTVNASGAGLGAFWTVRGVFTSQDYDQAFSVVNAPRDAERPTSLQHVDASSRAVTVEYLKSLGAITVVATATGRQVDADLTEELPPDLSSLPAPPVSATQRTFAGSSQLSWAIGPRATFAAGARAETWSTDAGNAGPESNVGSFVPRASFAFRAAPFVTLRASLQSAYRVPTINELYRGFRVGSVQTLANPFLTPEQSFGGDASVLVTRGRAVFRGTGFFATVDSAIVNVTIGGQSGQIVRRRANAGRIHANGIELESDFRLRGAVSATASGTFVSSTFGGDGELDGLRVPQVPRFQGAIGLRGTWSHATAAFDLRYAGPQFDDDRNQFLLRAATIADARVSWAPRRGVEVFVAMENVFDVEQDVGRTPLRTIGLPRTTRIGVRIAK